MTHELSRLEAIMDELRVGVVAVDSRGRVELQNPAASRILGLSTEATLGRPLADCIGAEHPAVALIRDALEAGREVLAHSCPLRARFGGEDLIVDLCACPISEDGVGGALLTLEDRTIGHELEELLDQRTRSELFAHLAAGIAHELGNPLGGIRGAAELLQKKLEDDGLRRYSELIRGETDRMRRLLEDLGELTRGGDLRLREANVHRVLDGILELHGRSEGWERISVLREYDPSIPEIEIDPDRLTQVLLNLMRNAVEAMGGKGTLTVRTRVDTDYHVSPDRPGRVHMLSIDVEDTGPGIPEEHVPHIFTPFFTRRPDGTGLGLAIAQHWTVRHGGRISVSSQPGRTRMRVLLPLRRSQ